MTCKSIDDDQAMQWYGDKGVVECLGIYTVDRVQSIIDNALPQSRNKLYSRNGNIIQSQPQSVVVNTLF